MFSGLKRSYMYGKTDKFYLRRYAHGTGRLRVGDVVNVRPFVDSDGVIVSQAKTNFVAVIIECDVNWCSGKQKELCTMVEGQHSAVINDYLFSRLERIDKEKYDRLTLSVGLFNWFKDIFR